jgi:beta-glucosidase-like glycosyl hydrolase
MKGVADAFPDHASSVESLIAGNDILCLPGDVEKTISKVKGAIAEGVLGWSQIDEHVRKLLLAKYQTGLAKWKPLPLEGLAIRLNEKTDGLKKEIAAKAITLAKLDDRTGFPLPAGRTASGMSMLMSNAGKSIKQVIANIDEHVIKPCIDRLYYYNMRYSDDADLKGDIHIQARGAASLLEKEAAQKPKNEAEAEDVSSTSSSSTGSTGSTGSVAYSVAVAILYNHTRKDIKMKRS